MLPRLLATLMLFLVSHLPPAASAQTSETATVVEVIDGDTVAVDLGGGNVQHVRYIGIDTPKLHGPTSPVECYGQEAQTTNATLVGGQSVTLVKDVSETDQG